MYEENLRFKYLQPIRIDNKEYYSVNILSSNKIMKKNIFDYMLYVIKNYSLFFNQNSTI